MLSIIISSYQPEFYLALEKNIAETIGIPYEVIKVDNPGKMGICEAYNQGAEQAQYDYLLFLHEDVLFITKDWGIALFEYFQNPKIGVIGIAGSNYVPNCPFAWWDHANHQFRNLIQYNKADFLREYKLLEDKEAVCLDGIFLACKKSTYKLINFEKSITSFHVYDINFSTKIAQHAQNIITSKIVIKHFSEGRPDLIWFKEIIKHRKSFHAPPSQKLKKDLEAFYFKIYLDRLQEFNFSLFDKIKYSFQYLNPKFIGWKIFFKYLNFIFFRLK